MTALLLALALSAQYTPDDAKVAFSAANEAYFRGDYAQAVDGYTKLRDDGYAGAAVQYNLGTALLAEGKVGPAILALERARRISPTDDDVTTNLERARRELVDKVSGAQDEPFIDRVGALVPLGNTELAFVVGYAALWIGVFFRRRLGGAGLGLIVLGGAVALVGGALLGIQIYLREGRHEAVVLGATVKVHEGPSASSKTSFELHEGTELRVLDVEGDFARVRLRNGLEGWAEAKDVAEI